MQLRDLILVSVDDHLIEPRDMFVNHMPARFKDRAPVVRPRQQRCPSLADRRAEGGPGSGSMRVAGRPKEEYGFEPVSYEQVRAGCYNVDARVGDMDANGVLGSICFGSFPGFAGARFQKMQDKDLALATLQAYNDWHMHDWCGRYPGPVHSARHAAAVGCWIGSGRAEADEPVGVSCRDISGESSPDRPASLHNQGWERLGRPARSSKWCCAVTSARRVIHPIRPMSPRSMPGSPRCRSRSPMRRPTGCLPGLEALSRAAYGAFGRGDRLDSVLPRARRLHLCSTWGLDTH